MPSVGNPDEQNFPVKPQIVDKTGRSKIVGPLLVTGVGTTKSEGKHLGLWEVKARPPPKATATPPDFHIDYSNSQVPPCEDYLYCDPDYSIDAYAS
jgi:hypothetical protein